MEDAIKNIGPTIAPEIANAIAREMRRAFKEMSENKTKDLITKTNTMETTIDTPMDDKVIYDIAKDPLSLTDDNRQDQNNKINEMYTQDSQELLPNAQIQPTGRLTPKSQPQITQSQTQSTQQPSLNLHWTPSQNQSSNHDQIIEELLKRVTELEKIVKQLKEKPPQQALSNHEQPAATKKQIYQPTAQMDHDGNTILESSQRLPEQPADWATVVSRRTYKEQRKQLSQSINNQVEDDLIKHFDKMNDKGEIKTKPKTKMNKDERDKTIVEMLKESSKYVGIAPISREHIIKVAEKLTNRGIIDKNAPYQSRIQTTIKSLVKSWTMKYLNMTEADWNLMQVDKIQTTDNSDIIFVKFKTQNDATTMTSKARNLPSDTGPNTPRLIMHVDVRAKKRHQAILQIAKTMREKSGNTIQTTVRSGKRDFLLRRRPKGSTIPWQEIPPIIITQRIPHFEVGDYIDIFNDKEDETKIEDDDEDDEDEIRRLSQNILNEQINEKRDRSDQTNTSNELSAIQNQRKHLKINENHDISSQEKDNDILNSTPIPVNIPETPAPHQWKTTKSHENNHRNQIPETPTPTPNPQQPITKNSIAQIPAFMNHPENQNQPNNSHQPSTQNINTQNPIIMNQQDTNQQNLRKTNINTNNE